MNPLFPQQNNPFSNMQTVMNQFNQFRQNFTGDPKQTVMNLLSSGQMTQGQYNQLSQMANTLKSMMGR